MEGEIDVDVVSSIINEKSLDLLRETFTRNTSNLVFRRVGRVFAKDEDFVQTVVERPTASLATESEVYGPESTFSVNELLQNVEHQYSKFYFFTTTTSLRENDRWGSIGIYGAANKHAELDVLGASFRFLPRNVSQVPPREGDLVCGLVNRPQPGRTNPEFKTWFICSEQFFHAWTAILYPDHESITKEFADEDKIRRYLMSGNRLCTNGFRKWTLSCQQSMVESNSDELIKRFYRLRSESASKDWVHVYAALVLMLRYKELPTATNVPNNLDKGPKMSRWDLPADWVEKVVRAYGLVVTQAIRKVVPLVRQIIPRGTHITITIDDKSLNLEEAASSDQTPSLGVHPKINISDSKQFPDLGD